MAAPTIVTAVNDILKMRVFCKANDQVAINVLYYRLVAIAVGTVGDLQETAAALSNRFAGPYRAVMGAAAEFRGVGLQTLHSGEPGVFPSVEVYANDGAGVGDELTNLCPRQTCGIITKKTVVPKRLGRGRIYVPFPAEGFNDDNGLPNAAYMAKLTPLAEALFTNFSVNTPGEGDNTLQPVLRSDATPANATDDVWVWRPIVDFTPRQRWATQRRRGSYGQTNVSPI